MIKIDKKEIKSLIRSNKYTFFVLISFAVLFVLLFVIPAKVR